MRADEAAVLLSHICAFDGREVTETAAMAWAAALPDVRLDEAIAALPGYYRLATRDSRNWIHPGDVLEGVRDIRRVQMARAGEAARASALEAGLTGVDVEAAVLSAARRVRDGFPETSRLPAASPHHGGW